MGVRKKVAGTYGEGVCVQGKVSHLLKKKKNSDELSFYLKRGSLMEPQSPLSPGDQHQE